MDKERVESYCRGFDNLLREAGREIPVGGMVTKSYYIYPFKRDHLLDFSYGKGTTSSLLNIGISVYRRLYGSAIRRDPYPWDDGICGALDDMSRKAMEDVGENVAGFMKEGEEYYVLSLIRNDWLNDFRARELTNMFLAKLEGRMKADEVSRMYY